MEICLDHFDSVEHLVAALRHYEPASTPRQEAYRGQANAEWSLVPSAFRPNTKWPTPWGSQTVEESMRALPPPTSGDVDYQGQARLDLEIKTLVDFFEATDAAGLPLPEDSQVIRARHKKHNAENWPTIKIRSILALAQHHGLPTRLLDWTWDWRVAAFFAARDSITMEHPPARLAIWSLVTADLSSAQWFDEISRRKPCPVVMIVTAPAASNPNLRAQKGLFTLLVPQKSGTPAGKPLDELAGEPGSTLRLTKRTLPANRAGALLHALAVDGMTAATVRPNYDGVVAGLRERYLWAPDRLALQAP